MVGLISLTIGLAIGRAESIGKKVAVDFFRYLMWKKLIGFFSFWTADDGS